MVQFLDRLLWLIRVKKEFKLPRQSRVLILDTAGLPVLMRYLAGYDPVVAALKRDVINVSLLFNFAMLRKFISGRKGLFQSYVESYIDAVKPVLVVTFIDNSEWFYSIKKNRPEVTTLFVQNGIRGYVGDVFEVLDRDLKSGVIEKKDLFVDYMLVMGKVSGELYKNYIGGRVLVMGSVKNNLISRKTPKKQGTIGFVPSFRMSASPDAILWGGRTWRELIWVPCRIILRFLCDYARRKNLKLQVIGNGLHVEEKFIYSEMAGEEVAFKLENNDPCGPTNFHGSYWATDECEVTVAAESTLGYESIARGNKTALFAFRGSMLGLEQLKFGWPAPYTDDGPFWTSRPDTAVFERILDHLFLIDDQQWRNEVEVQNFSALMAYDPGNTIFQSVVKKILGDPPVQLAGIPMTPLGGAAGTPADNGGG
jgi:surface carbohydrate biosynthesis protein